MEEEDDVVAAATPVESNISVYLRLRPDFENTASKYSVQRSKVLVVQSENQTEKHFSSFHLAFAENYTTPSEDQRKATLYVIEVKLETFKFGSHTTSSECHHGVP